LRQSANRHFSQCLQGCGNFHARKSGEPPNAIENEFLVSRGIYSAFAFVHAKRHFRFNDLRLKGFDAELRRLGLQTLFAYDATAHSEVGLRGHMSAIIDSSFFIFPFQFLFS